MNDEFQAIKFRQDLPDIRDGTEQGAAAEDDYSSDASTLGQVPVGGSASARIDVAGDIDWFRVELKAGVSYQIDLESDASGGNPLEDPVLLGLHDSLGLVIKGTRDDDGGEGNNSRVTFTPTEDGAYYVSAAAFGGDTGAYRLSVTQLTDLETEDYSSDTSTLGEVDVGGVAGGQVGEAGDTDWFRVELKAGAPYQIRLESRGSSEHPLEDPVLLGLHDESGLAIKGTQNDDSGVGGNSQLHFTPVEDGTYYVSAGAFGGDTGAYSISVAELVDDSYALSVLYSGEISQPREIDTFTVRFERGRKYQIDVEGADTEKGTLGDPYLIDIRHIDGSEASVSPDDNSGVGNNSRSQYLASQDGLYIIEVSGAPQGETGLYQISVREITDDHDSALQLYVASDASTVRLLPGMSVNGTLEVGGDEDGFLLDVRDGWRYVIDLEGSSTAAGTLDDPFLSIPYGSVNLESIDEEGNIIWEFEDDNGGVGNNSRLEVEADNDGTIVLNVSGGRFQGVGTYQLTVTAIAPDDEPASSPAGGLEMSADVLPPGGEFLDFGPLTGFHDVGARTPIPPGDHDAEDGHSVDLDEEPDWMPVEPEIGGFQEVEFF